MVKREDHRGHSRKMQLSSTRFLLVILHCISPVTSGGDLNVSFSICFGVKGRRDQGRG